MFIKLIEIYGEWQSHKCNYKLREIVVNKKNIMKMSEYKFKLDDKDTFPEGMNPSHKYTSITMIDNIDIIVIGELDHIYKFFEKDSELNYRQTLRG